MDDDRIINTIHAVEEDLSDNGFILHATRRKQQTTALKGPKGGPSSCARSGWWNAWR